MSHASISACRARSRDAVAVVYAGVRVFLGYVTSVELRRSGSANFCRVTAGLAAGVTEAVAVVTPMEVIKIRLQAQHHSMADPLDIPKYRNAAHALYTVVKEEGFGALYRGVSLTALRQGTNQAGMLQDSNPLFSRD